MKGKLVAKHLLINGPESNWHGNFKRVELRDVKQITCTIKLSGNTICKTIIALIIKVIEAKKYIPGM